MGNKYVVCCMDGDGHFNVALIQDKEKVLRVLQAVDDGEYFESVCEDNDIEFDMESILYMHSDSWMNWVRQFEQRGIFEIVKI